MVIPTCFVCLERQDFRLAPFLINYPQPNTLGPPSTVFKSLISIILIKKLMVMPTRFLRLTRQDFWLAPFYIS